MSKPVQDLRSDGGFGPGVAGPDRVALDLDNTIICYDNVFVEVARAGGLLGPDFRGGKRAVRDFIRQQPEGERVWQQVQGEVYGSRIGSAELYGGVEHFLRRCKSEGACVWVVSHKTQFNSFDPDRTDLRRAALELLEAKGLFGDQGLGLSPGQVFFEATRQDKIARLVALGCTHVVDDLVEVFADASFPMGARKILFDPTSVTGQGSWASWLEIEHEIFGPLDTSMAPSVNGSGSAR